MTDEALVLESSKLEQRVKSGAGWFFWIAALSFINSIMMNAGANYSFISDWELHKSLMHLLPV